MKCKKHPKYLGIHKPRVECPECKAIFAKAEKARNEVESTNTGYGGSDPDNYCGGY